jgi:branched-chain amino acid aminotransferase
MRHGASAMAAGRFRTFVFVHTLWCTFTYLGAIMSLPIDRTTTPRLDAAAIAANKLSNIHSDHMFIAEYAHGEWRKARIQPYRPIPMAPFALGLHYAQSVFEGMKAYRQDDGGVSVFRTPRHHARFVRSCERMCMPAVPLDLFSEAVHTLVAIDAGWVPPGPESAYYLRPFMFATEERMGLKIADEYLFMVLGGPFRPVFTKPLAIKVERQYVRAATGGTGSAKCAGNYAAAMYPTKIAKDEGFDQILWTDAASHSFVEESGAMNVMFVIDGVVTTPPLTDTILDGVTRSSVLQLCADLGLPAAERQITVDEVVAGIGSGLVSEAFGVGTAAAIAPIATIGVDGQRFDLAQAPGPVAIKIRTALDGIRHGQLPDTHGWMHPVPVISL